jgi:hypothetical protein
VKTAEQRFWSKVQGGNVETCWIWTATRKPGGYGKFHANGKAHNAHRWAYEQLVAEIPAGLVLDHLCRRRDCVNPWHMEPVTNRVNLRRGLPPGRYNAAKNRCDNGHEFTPENTYRTAENERHCRRCRAGATQRWRARQKLAAASTAA